MAKNLFIAGTSSGAGKSTLVTGLCRIFFEEGIRVAPFKSQNMTNNISICPDGRLIARSSSIAAAACSREPVGSMNPIVLKFSQGKMDVILAGRSAGVMDSSMYHRDQAGLWQIILAAYAELAAESDLIVMEGAGSPVEMNLKDLDVANLALAARVSAPVLLVADIDRGGAFASVYGTLMLLEPEERRLVKGIILNRLRGLPESFDALRSKLEEISGLPVVGMLPYLSLKLEDEDDLVDSQTGKKPVQSAEAQEAEIASLARQMRQHLDLDGIRRIIGEGN